MLLRVARPDDFELLVQLVREYYAFDEIPIRPTLERGIKSLLDNPNVGSAWFIESDAEVAGYIVLTYAFDHEFGGRTGWITDFFLRERCRGKGLGAEAIRRVLEFATEQGCNTVDLVVTPHNSTVPEFYRKQGFERSDRTLFSISLAPQSL